jgi:hypothetical protein
MAPVTLIAEVGEPALNVKPPEGAVTGALIAMAPAALRVSALLLVQLTALATVMLPASLPLDPVETVTLALASALSSVETCRMDSLPVGVQVPEEQVAAGEPDAVWIVTS